MAIFINALRVSPRLVQYFLIGLIGVASISAHSQDALPPSQEIENLFSAYSRDTAQYFPFTASENGVAKYASVFANDLSEEWRTGLKGVCNSYLSKLSEIKKEEQTAQTQLSTEIFQHKLLACVKSFENTWHLMPINQTGSGWPSSFPVIGAGNGNQPFKTTKNYGEFLKRIDGFIVWVDTAIANMRIGMAQGITPPRALMVKVVPQLEAHIVDDPKKSAFYQPLNKFPDDVDEQTKALLAQEYVSAITGKIVPAYRRLRDFIQDEYVPRCRTTHGISDLPNGREMYRTAVMNATTTDMTPEQISELGLSEVARITREIALLRSEIITVQEKELTQYPTVATLVDGYRDLKGLAEVDLNRLFGRIPKSSFEIKAIEPFREKSMSSSYVFPSMDGRRPGVFYLNAASVRSDGYGVISRSLFLHEAVPGHHFQVALQRENKELPFFRRIGWYSAFGEGWALYAEGLGSTLGLYENRHDKLVMLNLELLRAARLVVDVGLHHYGWSREKGIQYLHEVAEQSAESAEREVERYMAWPGQALSYKVGQLKILEIRKKAESRLGDTFDIRAFHDEILKDGSMPLGILDAKMDKWILSKQK